MAHLTAMQVKNRFIRWCEQVHARSGDMHNDQAAILLGPLAPHEAPRLEAVQSS